MGCRIWTCETRFTCPPSTIPNGTNANSTNLTTELCCMCPDDLVQVPLGEDSFECKELTCARHVIEDGVEIPFPCPGGSEDAYDYDGYGYYKAPQHTPV